MPPPPPRTTDLCLLRDLAGGLAASVVAERRGMSLAYVADRICALRRYYDVASTAAAARQAIALGRLPPTAA